ncbi:hypothetical protein ACWDA7_02140 [Streptomyces sp. NPDC001156]
MPESVPVHCPACRREHLYTAPAYPCPCGAPVAPPLSRCSTPFVITHRTWDEEWVTVRCARCAREDQWPQPELGCPCGAVLRIPLHGGPRPADPSARSHPDDVPDPGLRSQRSSITTQHGTGRESSPTGFRPVAIRTPRDAVTATALYLRRLGYRDVRRAAQRPPNGIGLAARGILAQVDPTPRPAAPRDVECLWLTAMSESVRCAYFSLAGYDDDARSVANRLGVALFVLDLTGTPQPVNSPADELAAGRG